MLCSILLWPMLAALQSRAVWVGAVQSGGPGGEWSRGRPGKSGEVRVGCGPVGGGSGGGQNFAPFFPSPDPLFFFFSIFVVFRGIVVGCTRCNIEKVFTTHLEFCGHLVTALASPEGRGFTRQPENSKRAHLRVPALQTPPTFHERTQQREKKERKMWWEREKKARNFGLPPFRAPTFGAPPSRLHPSTNCV